MLADIILLLLQIVNYYKFVVVNILRSYKLYIIPCCCYWCRNTAADWLRDGTHSIMGSPREDGGIPIQLHRSTYERRQNVVSHLLILSIVLL